MMLRHVRFSRADHSLLLLWTDGVFRGLGVLPRLDFYENENVAIPRNDVDLAALNPVAGSNDAVAEGTQVVDAQNLAPPAEG